MGLTIFGVDLFPSYDVVDPATPTAQKLAEHIEVIKQNETGWDRLKAIFQRDDFGNLSPELDGSLSAATAGLVIGAFLGGIPASKRAHEEFIMKNKATTFENHFQAKDKLQFSVTKAMASAGWKVGWRLGLFTGAYTFFTTAVATYRNQTTIFEYTAGGLLAGAMYKFPMGPKAMVAGGLGGAVLGTAAGAVSVGVMKLTGTTSEELRYLRHGWKEAKARELSLDSPTRKEAIGPLSIAHDYELAMKNRATSEKDEQATSEVLKKEKQNEAN